MHFPLRQQVRPDLMRAMKVVRDHPDQLILEDSPVLMTVLLVVMALVFLCIGVGMMFSDQAWFGVLWVVFTVAVFGLFLVLFVRRNQLILDAGTGVVTHRRRTLRTYWQVERDLAHLERAIVQTSRSSESSAHRMALVYGGGMDEGIHPFTAVYTSGRGAARGAEAVNRWLDALRARG